jgi:hypothetical protein
MPSPLKRKAEEQTSNDAKRLGPEKNAHEVSLGSAIHSVLISQDSKTGLGTVSPLVDIITGYAVSIVEFRVQKEFYSYWEFVEDFKTAPDNTPLIVFHFECKALILTIVSAKTGSRFRGKLSEDALIHNITNDVLLEMRRTARLESDFKEILFTVYYIGVLKIKFDVGGIPSYDGKIVDTGVTAYLSRENDRIEVFKSNGSIYDVTEPLAGTFDLDFRLPSPPYEETLQLVVVHKTDDERIVAGSARAYTMTRGSQVWVTNNDPEHATTQIPITGGRLVGVLSDKSVVVTTPAAARSTSERLQILRGTRIAEMKDYWVRTFRLDAATDSVTVSLDAENPGVWVYPGWGTYTWVQISI